MEDNNKNEVFIPCYLTVTLSVLIGKFRIQVYEDLELIRSKKTLLETELDKLKQAADGDQVKMNELWEGNTELLKKDFAWLTKKSFKEQIAGLGLNVEQVILLEEWIVKEE